MVIVDTAGRLHTQHNLMEELDKVRRVITKQMPDAPHETLMTVDATTGQNGVRQAKLFGEAVGVTGIVLTKLDGTAKGGIALAIANELGIPVKLIGIGEQLEDLRPFDPDDFARRCSRHDACCSRWRSRPRAASSRSTRSTRRSSRTCATRRRTTSSAAGSTATASRSASSRAAPRAPQRAQAALEGYSSRSTTATGRRAVDHFARWAHNDSRP